jgi:hypothetical protein
MSDFPESGSLREADCTMKNPCSNPDDALVIAETVQWLERAVIGLNLCPFAKSVHAKGQVHYVVSHAASEQELLEQLRDELLDLQGMPAQTRDTTLLILPGKMENFLLFNDFLNRVEKLLRRHELEGVLQIASFHPKFQFVGTEEDDISNFTNRAPYPILHLLREESIDRAVAVFPQAEEIFEKNMQTLASLGPRGWNALGLTVRASEANQESGNEKN